MIDVEVSTKNVRDWGTLLQDAVHQEKTDFVRILMEYRFVFAVFVISHLFQG